MDNHHFYWQHFLFMVIFHSYVNVDQRVVKILTHTRVIYLHCLPFDLSKVLFSDIVLFFPSIPIYSLYLYIPIYSLSINSPHLYFHLYSIVYNLFIYIFPSKVQTSPLKVRRIRRAAPRRTPFVELPLGATEDRVTGTINIERALKEAGKVPMAAMAMWGPC